MEIGHIFEQMEEIGKKLSPSERAYITDIVMDPEVQELCKSSYQSMVNSNQYSAFQLSILDEMNQYIHKITTSLPVKHIGFQFNTKVVSLSFLTLLSSIIMFFGYQYFQGVLLSTYTTNSNLHCKQPAMGDPLEMERLLLDPDAGEERAYLARTFAKCNAYHNKHVVSDMIAANPVSMIITVFVLSFMMYAWYSVSVQESSNEGKKIEVDLERIRLERDMINKPQQILQNNEPEQINYVKPKKTKIIKIEGGLPTLRLTQSKFKFYTR